MNLLSNTSIKTLIYYFMGLTFTLLVGGMVLSHFSLSSIENTWVEYQEEVIHKQTLLEHIESEFGYGGAIHNFNNYLIRGDEQYLKDFNANYEHISKYIKEFESIGHITAAENTMLTESTKVLDQYSATISTIGELLTSGISIKEIDSDIKINDAPALDAFRTLSKNYKHASEGAHTKLEGAIVNSEMISITSILLVGIMMFILKILTEKRILQPLSSFKKTLTRLTNGESNVDLTVKTKDEIGGFLTAVADMYTNIQEKTKTLQKDLDEGATLASTIEGLGTNVLITDINDELVYANKQSMKNLTELTEDIRKTFTGFDVNKLMGSSIHQFHKDPDDVRKKLNALQPGQQHRAIISIGELKLSLNAGGVFDKQGKRTGSYVEWNDVTHQNRVEVQIKETAGAINSATQDISQGNVNLSERTESQAASIEETTASMQQLTERVNETATSAREASELSSTTKDAADRGGNVVKTAITAMAEISDSSKKINEIIGVIDEIAFQTNLLALNAAVEAARAGEQGRGFAVVASEVRNLAGRSAKAAKEIKELITDSVEKVESGTQQVNDTGSCLDEIITSVQQVTSMVNTITEAAQDQANGIDEINKAITQMDSFTQQNASLVEEAASASEALSEQSANLVEIINTDK